MKRKGLTFPAIRIQKTTLFHLSGIIAVTFLACYPVLHNRLLDLWDDQWQVVSSVTHLIHFLCLSLFYLVYYVFRPILDLIE